MNEVEREQTKLFANALDRASTACLAVGVLTPLSAVFFAMPGYSTTPIWIIEFGVGAWMLCTLGITFNGHAGSQRTARMTELQLLAFVILPAAIVAVAYAALRYREHRMQVVHEQRGRAAKG